MGNAEDVGRFAEELLKAADCEPTEELKEHLLVFLQAVKICNDRTHAYGLVWRQYGALSNLLSAARKVDRLMQVWWFDPDGGQALHKDALDDAFDLLNYTCFFIQNARMGNIQGTPPRRPLRVVKEGTQL
jgi:hypothetical protein